MVQLCIVLDTNVLLSGTAYPKSIPGEIVSAWRSGSLEVKLSQYILDELQRVLPRLNNRLGWSSSEIREFVDSLAFLADLVDPVPASEHYCATAPTKLYSGHSWLQMPITLSRATRIYWRCPLTIPSLLRLSFGDCMAVESRFVFFTDNA